MFNRTFRKIAAITMLLTLLAPIGAWAGGSGIKYNPAPGSVAPQGGSSGVASIISNAAFDEAGRLRFVRAGLNTDSTNVSIATLVSDTSRVILLRDIMPAVVSNSEVQFGALATDTAKVFVVSPTWTTPAGAAAAAGDTAGIIVQFSFDGTNWTSATAPTYNTVANVRTGVSGQPIFVWRWHNIDATMDQAPYLRVIVNNIDNTSAITRLFTVFGQVLTKGN